MRLHATALFAIALSAASAFAADLTKYKNWDESPQGYFMTRDERAQWSAIKSDAEAEKFVADFVAKRGPKFVDEVATRAQNADKYLSMGKVKGSETLRGKVVILFGPPAGLTVGDRKGRSSYSSAPPSTAVSNLGGSASTRDNDGDGQSINASKSGQAFKDFEFSYRAAAVPGLGEDYSVTVEADAATGKDRIRDKKKAAELDDKFEAVAKASIKQ